MLLHILIGTHVCARMFLEYRFVYKDSLGSFGVEYRRKIVNQVPQGLYFLNAFIQVLNQMTLYSQLLKVNQGEIRLLNKTTMAIISQSTHSQWLGYCSQNVSELWTLDRYFN